MKIKKLLLVGVVSLVGVSSVSAQGTVNFVNRITGTLDAPVYLNGVGGTLLSGANFLAQLYYGTSPTESSLTPITDPPTPFRTGTGAGYWNAGADSTRVLPVIAPNSVVYLQVRAWDSTFGATYDIAKAAGGVWGDSNVFTAIAGGGSPPVAPANMTGLTSFTLVPEPSTIALGILGAVALLLRRRN